MNTRRSKRSRELDATASPDKNEAPAKRIASGPSTSAPADDIEDKVSLSIVIKWSSMSDVDGRTKVKVNRLSLKELENVDKLGGLSKGLMERAFPAEARPDYLQDEQFCRWTPDETCLSYPLDVTKTEFKLCATYRGWEYVVNQYTLGSNIEPADRKLFVTVIEFESVAVVLGNLGIRVSLVAYPVICVKKTFLEDISQQIRNKPATFKGILN